MDHLNEDESILSHKKPVQSTPIPEETEEETFHKYTGSKYTNKAGKVKISFESNGKFSTKPVAYFSDYKMEHTNDITLCRDEDLLETVILVLDQLKDPETSSISEFTLEELFEALVGLKIQFISNEHTVYWICKCQSHKNEEDRKYSEDTIELSSLKYVNIQDTEEKLQQFYLEAFNDMSDEEFEEYLDFKYKDEVDKRPNSRIEESKTIIIKEPYVLRVDEDSYSFRFTRVKDLLDGYKLACEKFDGKINLIKSKQPQHGVSYEEQKEKKESEIRKIEHEKAKYAILAAKAMTLVKFNGRELVQKEEKISLFKSIPNSKAKSLDEIEEKMKFGIQDERELICNLCGKPDRRLLQRDIRFTHLLPSQADSDVSSKGKLRKCTAIDVHFGI